jgi:hypothetical protein
MSPGFGRGFSFGIASPRVIADARAGDRIPRFELLHGLWMELEKHHFRVRDLLMRASTSSQGIVSASPLSI